MKQSPEDFEELRKLLALKRHEQPPPGYFYYLPEKVMVKIEQHDLSEYSTWWEWLVARFDARPILAGAYAFVISGLLLMGFRVSQLMQSEAADGSFPPFAKLPDPNTITPGGFVSSHFANPVGLFTSLEPVVEPTSDPLPLERAFTVHSANFVPAH
jgi:hypothetical protein